MDQEEEIRQMGIEKAINKAFDVLYTVLQLSDRIEAEESLGMVAEAKAVWENDAGSSDKED